MSELDFKKQLLINEFKTLSKGKSNDEILPLILALSRKAQQLLPQLLMLLEQR